MGITEERVREFEDRVLDIIKGEEQEKRFEK